MGAAVNTQIKLFLFSNKSYEHNLIDSATTTQYVRLE